MEYKYDHFGVPVKQKKAGMIYFPEYKVWCSEYEHDPYRIEWLFFEGESPLHPLIQTVSHVCFLVNDMEKAIFGKKVLLKPARHQDYHIAFVEENGVPIEFIEMQTLKK